MSVSSGLLRQVALLPAGGQPWFKNVLACKGKRFAYAATLAVYVYQYSNEVSQFVLDSVISVSTKTITGIAWHPKNDDLLAVASRDPLIVVWSVSNHCAVAQTCMVSVRPLVIAWHQDDYDAIIYCDEKGPLYLWKNVSPKGTSLRSSDGLIRREQQQWKSVQWKEIPPFNSAVTHARWHPTVPGKLAFGHNNGTISLYIKDRKAERHFAVVPEGYWEAFQESSKDNKCNQSISAMEWDPQSQSYILVILGGRCMFLLDTALENSVVVQRYTPPSKAVSLQTVAWIPGAPGVFVTGDCDTGVLRVWSVSQESPLESIRLKQTGFQALCTLPKCGSKEEDKPTSASSRSMATKTSVSYKKLASPTGKLVALFIDGGSGVYDLSLRKWDFKQEMGHVETIFDCQFKGESVDLLATTSYDGTMKIWDITTMTPVTSSPGDETVIYSLSWAPGDIDCIAAATSKRGVVIWDIAKGLISRRFTSHGKSACVYCVAWNQKDARKIASGGTDSQCLVHQADGKLMHTLRHPATVYGCDWHPSNEAILATACEDKAIRIFSVTTGNVEPIKTLQGHGGKVFKVRWSPLRESLLCSTSDDHTVKVWDYSSDSCLRTLIGHTDCVRGACWSPEIPHILITGSWDSTIRIWDTRDGTCLDTIHDHGADVYGLACHPRRPFLLASSSRDSTLRLWSLQPLAATLHAKCLLNQPMEQVFAFNVEGASTDNPDSSLKLCGKASVKIHQSLKCIGDEWEKEAPLIISPFFCYSKSIDNFLDLISVLQGKDLSRLSPSYAKAQVIHYKHLARFQTSRAQQLELVKMTRFGSGGIGAPSREASLEQAAEIYLLLGNLQKYCELKMELGEWLLALSVAPAISLDFWKKSTEKYSALVRNSSTLLQAAPHLAATRNQKQLVQLLANHGMWQKALTVAAEMKKIQEDDNQQPPLAVEEDPATDTTDENTQQEAKEVPYENGPRLNLLNECVENLSEFHLQQGAPVTAAAYHLSIDDVSSAMNALLRGHEMELAIALGQALDFKESAYQCALYSVAFKGTKRGEWDLAVDVINMSTVNDTPKIQLGASCPLTLVERNKLQERLGLPDVQASLLVAEEALTACQVGQDDELILKEKAISHYLISNRPIEGLKLGLDTIRDCLSKGSWNMSNLWSIIQKLAYVKASILSEDSNSRLCNELQLYTSYLGALAAIYLKYNPIVKPLYSQTSFFLAKLGNIALPITFEQLTSEIHAWELCNVMKTTLNGEQEQTYQEIQSHLEGWNSPFIKGEVIVTGGHLPRHSDQHRCIISGKSIKGPIFVLDDGKSAMSLSNAIMWARVNPFSPLGTGLRINPF